MHTWRAVLVVTSLIGTGAMPAGATGADLSRTEAAEQYFRGVYGCNTRVVDDLASSDVRMTYPGFEKLVGKPALVGRLAVRSFAEHFCRKWIDRRLVIHDVISDHDRVVLVWSFSARDADAAPGAGETAWGGISLLKFDDEGRIAAEIGEESAPGPIARLQAAGQ